RRFKSCQPDHCEVPRHRFSDGAGLSVSCPVFAAHAVIPAPTVGAMITPPGGPSLSGPARPRPARRGVAPLRDFPTILWLCVAGVVAVLQPVITASTRSEER